MKLGNKHGFRATRSFFFSTVLRIHQYCKVTGEWLTYYVLN